MSSELTDRRTIAFPVVSPGFLWDGGYTMMLQTRGFRVFSRGE